MIRKMILWGESGLAIAAKYGISGNHVSQIKHDRAWRHVPWDGDEQRHACRVFRYHWTQGSLT